MVRDAITAGADATVEGRCARMGNPAVCREMSHGGDIKILLPIAYGKSQLWKRAIEELKRRPRLSGRFEKPCWECDHGPDEVQHRTHRYAEQPEWDHEQPDKRVGDQCQQGDGPT